jgi:hypothetical protein
VSKHITIARTEGAEAGLDAFLAWATPRDGSGIAAPVQEQIDTILRTESGRKRSRKAMLSAYCSLHGVTVEPKARTTRKAEPVTDAADNLLAAVAAKLGVTTAALAALVSDEDEDGEEYETQLAPSEFPEDRASNRILNRLAVEGMLRIVPGDERDRTSYIRQDEAEAALTAVFGPLS